MVRFKQRLMLLVLFSNIAAQQAQQKSLLSDILRDSALIANCTDAQEAETLKHLEAIIHAPIETSLLFAHGLQYGADTFFRDQLTTFPHLTQDNLEAWLQHAGTFIDRHANGTWEVEHPTNPSFRAHVPLTALTGLPMARRFLLARLATVWLTSLHRSLPLSLEPQLQQLVKQLYNIHSDSVVRRGVMQYFHISKSGGTTWHAAAKSNGCSAPSTLGKHMRGFGDECRWLDRQVYMPLSGGKGILWARWGMVRRPAAGRDCWGRYGAVVAGGYSYTSNEYTLVGDLADPWDTKLCPQFVNVVTLRDPIQRLASALRFISTYIKLFWQRDNPPDQAIEAFTAVFCNASADFWRSLAPPVVDNYMVRSFLGERGFHVPVGTLQPAHTAAATHQLLQFDLVFDLEAGEAVGDRLANWGLGWPAAWSKQLHLLNSTELANRMRSHCHPDPEAWEQLQEDQSHDKQLYSFGRVVSQLDSLWVDMARALGLQPSQPPARERRERRELSVQQEEGGGAGSNSSSSTDSRAEPRCGMLWRGSNGSTLAHAMGLAG